jgi:excisionase family DNA binding protein
VADQEFYSFNEALDKLRLKEEELKRLVSEGEIRAFRDGETMRLRISDVENLQSELQGGEVVDLGGSGEELVFEDDADLEEAGMATEEISEMDTLLEEDVEDIGELEIEEEEEVVTTAPVRRQAAAAIPEPEAESMGMRLALIATAVVLILALPIIISISKGEASGLAKSIAGIFADI